MISRIVKYSVKNILRNKILSIFSVMILSLLIFIINILIILHDVGFQLIDVVNKKMTISLYLSEKYNKDSQEVASLINSIKNQNKNVTVMFKTKEQNLDKIKQIRSDLARIIEKNNPLPNSITISNIEIFEYPSVNKIIESKSFILKKIEGNKDSFINYNAQYNKITGIINILTVLKLAIYIIIFLFLSSIVVIIYSVIGNFVYYLKDEISIIRLVGGSRNFIYGPFIIQGIIYSCLAFIFSFIAYLILFNYVNSNFSDIYTIHFSNSVFIIQFFLFISIGAFAGYFSSKKYIK